MGRAGAYVKANFPDVLEHSAVRADHRGSDKFKVRTVHVAAHAVVRLIFMQAVGFRTTIVAANGQASQRDLNVILTLDRSGPMASSKFCDPMKAAVLGLITFMQSASVDYAPITNFKTQNPTLSW